MKRQAKAMGTPPRAVAEITPAIRFFGQHRYFAETGEMITSGVVEVREVIGVTCPTADYFVCGKRLQRIDGVKCPHAVCACRTCLIDKAEDEPRATAKAIKQCKCVKCRRQRRSTAKTLARDTGRRPR